VVELRSQTIHDGTPLDAITTFIRKFKADFDASEIANGLPVIGSGNRREPPTPAGIPQQKGADPGTRIGLDQSGSKMRLCTLTRSVPAMAN
jgi:hypothetical protein